MSFLELCGALALLWLAISFASKTIRALWRNGLAHRLGFGVRWRPGTWAVVTGASDGIGLEYARQLAEKGYKVLLIARNEKKLDEKADWIRSRVANCPELRTLAVDFSRADIYPTIAASLASLHHVDVLVNNVGVMHRYPEYFHLCDDDYINSLLNVNIVAITKMCELVLPTMLEQKRGIIINLSSIASSFPLPLFTIYSASKIYIDYLSRGLAEEYSKMGVVVQSVLPGAVRTNLSKLMLDVSSNAATAVDGADYVEQALKSVGIESRTFGHKAHGIEANLAAGFVALIGEDRVMRLTRRWMASMRLKFLKSKKKE